MGIKRVRIQRAVIILGLVTAISVGLYLIASYLTYRPGFPLDDAWIHQTYARSIGMYGEWAFVPGQPSAGSTSPLWSGLITIGYVLPVDPILWTYILGWGTLFGLAVLGSYTFSLLCPDYKGLAVLAGVLLGLEWHLVWASLSGMETSLFTLMALLVITWLLADWRRWFGLGIIIGLSIWIRPDGITLLGPALLVIGLLEIPWGKRARSAFALLGGFALLFGFYLFFNLELAGAWWPNTFYAKQAEYAIELQDPFWRRIFEQALMPLVGVGVILLPGSFIYLRTIIIDRSWAALGGGIWAIGYLGLYALRLPVTYQHGRYVIPMMPIYFLWSLAGLVGWVQPNSLVDWRRITSRIWFLSTAAILLLFWFLGARAYGKDVAIIESEMVRAAHWVAQNTDPGDLVAAHDIGALGYFGERDLLDLAGLVSPQVIPIIRDEVQLEEFLDSQGANYLVTFPGWYPYLVKIGEPLYSTEGVHSLDQGGENMVVYRWRLDSGQ